MNRTSFRRTRYIAIAASLVLTLSIAFASCRKEEDPQTPVNPTPVSGSYSFPLTDHSYWIYQQEQTDSLGNVISLGVTDSVYVEGNSVIGFNTYKTIKTVSSGPGSWFYSEYVKNVRDSAGYIVDQYGQYIEHDNFTDTLARKDFGTFKAAYFMRHRDSTVTVPAGTFTTVDYEGDYYPTFSGYPWSVPHHSHEIYASGVGKIVEITFFTSSPGYIQRRLIRYHIQQ